MNFFGMDRRLALTCLALAVMSLGLHARTLGFEFVDFDDPTVLLNHPNLYDENSLMSSLSEIFFGYMPREEPLLVRDITWAIDARLFGFKNPFGYHLGNVVLNALNVCLLFLFLFRSTRRYDFALVVAALFGVLPIHVEPVSWVMGRKDMLSAFFVLAALLAQTAELDSEEARGRRVFFGLSLVFVALALLSKISAVSLVVVLALHRIFLPDLRGERSSDEPADLFRATTKTLLRLAPHGIVTAGIVLWYGRILNAYGVTGWRGLGPTDPEHLWNVARFAPLTFGKYVRQTFLIDQPSLFYRWPHVEIPLTQGELLTSLLIGVFVIGAVIYCLVRRRDLAFYLLSFLGFLVPYFGIVYVGFWSADRYVYLSSFCLVAIATAVLMELHRRTEGPVRALILAVPIGFGLSSVVYTLQHQGVWRDAESSWLYEAYRDEPSLLSIQALSKMYVNRAERERDPEVRVALLRSARREIFRGFEREKALGRVAAPYATSEQLQLANLHYLLGRLARLEQAPVEQQLAHYERSHSIAPNQANTLMLAGAYFELGNRSDSPNREQRIGRSLDYFAEHMRYSVADQLRHEKNLTLLAQNYEQHFPFLHERVAQVRASMSQ